MNFNTHPHAQRDLFSAALPKDTMQIDLQAMFLLLPQRVEQKLQQLGFSTPIPSLDSDWYMHRLDSRIEADRVEFSTTPGRPNEVVQRKIQNCLRRFSTEALALHLYISDLLKLM